MAQSYPDPWMDKYWSLRHLLLDIAHMGRDEFVRTADIMELIKALIQTIREQIDTLGNVGSAAQLVGVLEGTIKDLEQELKG